MITIHLPISKSIQARNLMISAYSGRPATAEDPLGECDDLRALRTALRQIADMSATVFVQQSGTALRFLLPYLASRPWADVVVKGEGRLHERPIGPLVEALRALGADITYLEREGFAPVHVRGRSLVGPEVAIEGGMSSQFVSGLMLMAPGIGGLRINLRGKTVSEPYYLLTGKLMEYAGIAVHFEGEGDRRSILIGPGTYGPGYLTELDWSAAAYFYEALSLMPDDTVLLLEGLTNKHLQADSAAYNGFRALGIETTFCPEGVRLRRVQRRVPDKVIVNGANVPDLVPTMALSLAMAGIAFEIHGVKHLKIKESDRVGGFVDLCQQCGWDVQAPDDDTLCYDGSPRHRVPEPIFIDPHADHRMAMVFAVAGLKYPILVTHPEVVNKSFPDFFNQLEKLCRAR